MAVRALVLDVFGTLVDRRSASPARSGRAGVGDPLRARRRVARPLPADPRRGQRRARRGALRRPAPRHPRRPPRRARGRVLGRSRRALVGARHRLDPWPDVRPGLEALRGERPVAMLSNGHVALLVDLARHGDLRFDAVLSAELAQAYKPDPRPTAPRRACSASSRPSSHAGRGPSGDLERACKPGRRTSSRSWTVRSIRTRARRPARPRRRRGGRPAASRSTERLAG